MKQAVLLAVFIGIILVACSNGVSTAVEQAANIDATVSAAVAATRTASDVQEKVAATLSAPTPTTAPPTPTTESASTVKKILDKVLPLRENHFNEGVEYYEGGQYENAIQEFDKAIQIGGDYDAGAYNNRGYSYAELGQHQNAIDDYTEAIRIGSHDYIVLNSRVTLYVKRGEHQAAIDDYNELIRISPTAPGYYKGRAAAYRALGHISLANADQAKACSLNREFC